MALLVQPREADSPCLPLGAVADDGSGVGTCDQGFRRAKQRGIDDRKILHAADGAFKREAFAFYKATAPATFGFVGEVIEPPGDILRGSRRRCCPAGASGDDVVEVGPAEKRRRDCDCDKQAERKQRVHMKHNERAKPDEVAAVHIPCAEPVNDQIAQGATQKEWSERRRCGVPATENRATPRENEHGSDVGDGANYNFAQPCRNRREPLPP